MYSCVVHCSRFWVYKDGPEANEASCGALEALGWGLTLCSHDLYVFVKFAKVRYFVFFS